MTFLVLSHNRIVIVLALYSPGAINWGVFFCEKGRGRETTDERIRNVRGVSGCPILKLETSEGTCTAISLRHKTLRKRAAFSVGFNIIQISDVEEAKIYW